MQALVKGIKSYMRPRVVVQVRPSKTSTNILNFEIKNVGNTAAYDISCRFAPDIKYLKTDMLLSQLRVFNNLGFLAPKEEIIFLFDNAIEYFNDPSRPMEIEATISYGDETNEKYEEKIPIKINQLEKLLFAEERGIEDVVDRLRRIERELDKIGYFISKKERKEPSAKE